MRRQESSFVRVCSISATAFGSQKGLPHRLDCKLLGIFRIDDFRVHIGSTFYHVSLELLLNLLCMPLSTFLSRSILLLSWCLQSCNWSDGPAGIITKQFPAPPNFLEAKWLFGHSSSPPQRGPSVMEHPCCLILSWYMDGDFPKSEDKRVHSPKIRNSGKHQPHQEMCTLDVNTLSFLDAGSALAERCHPVWLQM